MTVNCTRRLEFDYGHRVLGHKGKCAALHGHRGVVEITVEAERLDDLGMVVDFSKIKELVGGWIDREWDHNMVLHPHDPLTVIMAQPVGTTGKDHWEMTDGVFAGRKPFVMPHFMPNPTAENMAQVLMGEARALLYPLGIRVVRVRFYETPNAFAEVSA